MSDNERPGERLAEHIFQLSHSNDPGDLVVAVKSALYGWRMSDKDAAMLDRLARDFLASYGVEVP
jgi:hypothetical protein